ncbi:hypothetical protein [Aliiroseovarius sp.]|uniref:hypothetical protein n=1 Tax=Aliiroseovarius sp. TaxID=1872442 RepID=UPI002635236F|nr:hypothetical protein [Aliiroseovarius sp.]
MARSLPSLTKALAAFLACTLPVQAQDALVPQGCEAFLTVQTQGCTSLLMWRCEKEPEGYHWAAAFDGQGLLSMSSYDHQYQWLDTTYLWDNSREVLLDSEDPIHMDDLLDIGHDTFAFTVRRTMQGQTRKMRVIGADVLTGERVTIDGIELEELSTELRYFTEAGDVDYQSRGTQYVSRELRLFFPAVDQVVAQDGGTIEYDSRPVDFIHPGEPGFGATTPLYGCEEIKTRLPRPHTNIPAPAPDQPTQVWAPARNAPKGESQ